MKLSRITTAVGVAVLVVVTLYAPAVFGFQTGEFIMRATMNEALYRMVGAITADETKTTAATLHNDQASAALGRLKGLAGEWQAVDAHGKRATLNYQIVSGGSAVMETFSSEALPAGNDMVTVYYLDGGRLVLTHYCMAKNQPHMQATRFSPDTGELDFEFVSGENINPSIDGHMHTAKFRFIDDKHFASEWPYFEGGKPKFAEVAQYTRVQ
jgi:hypothetical protein